MLLGNRLGVWSKKEDNGLTHVKYKDGSRRDYDVVTIGSDTIDNILDVVELDVGSSVTTIGQYCFQNHENLENVKYDRAASLLNIETKAFYGVQNLKTLYIPSTVTYLGEACFADTMAESIVFESGSTQLNITQKWVFSGNSYATSFVNRGRYVYLTNRIDTRAFLALSQYTDDGVAEVDLHYFICGDPSSTAWNCLGDFSVAKIQTVKLGNVSKEFIGRNLFYDSHIDNVVFDNVNYIIPIHDSCFRPASGMKNVFARNLGTLGGSPIVSPDMETLEIDNTNINLTAGQYFCDACGSLKSIKLKCNYFYAGNGLCRNCTSLEEFNLSQVNQLVSYNSGWFQNCPSTFKIVVPDNLYNSYMTNWSARSSQIVKASDYTTN